MGRKRKRQQTDQATEAASSRTAKKRSAKGGGKRSRQMTGTPDVVSGSSTHTSDVTIHQLDNLALTEIFDKLETKTKARVARVCKRWRDVVYCPALWKHVAPFLDPRSLSPADLDSLKRRGIRTVSLSEYTNRKKLRNLIYGLPSLEAVRLIPFKERVSNRKLAEIFPEALPSLKKLELYLYNMDGETLKFVRDHFPNLSHLWINVHDGFDFPDQTEQMPSLIDLSIYHTNLNNQMLHRLSRAYPNLQRLECCLEAGVTDAGLQQLGLLKELRFLRPLGSSFPLSSTSAEKLQNLHVLKIASANIGDEQLDALAQLHELEELEISCEDISEKGWRALRRGFRKLKCLLLDGIHCHEDTEVEHFGSLLSLKKVDLNLRGATHSKMKSLCCALKHVHSMTIRCGHLRITEHVMEDITDMNNLKELRFFGTGFDDDALTKLANGRAPLEALTFCQCECNLGERLLDIARQKQSIRQLEVKMNVNLAVLSQIVRQLPGLKVLRTSASAPTRQKLECLKPGLTVERIDE